MVPMGKKAEVVILCGGKGTRLSGSIPEYLPKCLAPIGGKPFLDILVEKVERDMPESKIVLAAGHLVEAVEAFAGDRKWWMNPFEIVTDSDQKGTAQCAHWLAMRSESANTLFLNGDTWFEDSLAEIVYRHKSDWYTPLTASVRYGGGFRGAFVLTQQYIARYKSFFQGRDLNDRFCLDVAKTIGPVKFHFSDKPFYDIGTPEGLETFRSFWERRVKGEWLSSGRRTASLSSAGGPTTPRTS